jgi:hypothetical protein
MSYQDLNEIGSPVLVVENRVFGNGELGMGNWKLGIGNLLPSKDFI